jgi:streptomycin 6-kinase
MTKIEREVLPEKFIHTILESHGANGEKWLANLPAIIAELTVKWQIFVEKPFPNLSYNFVAPCVCADKSEAVLKIGFPEEDSPIFNEAEMLKMFSGSGAVKLLRFDRERYALLLEKLIPGEHLKTIFRADETKAVEIAIRVLRKIKQEQPPKHEFMPLENWFRGFQQAKNTNFPAQAVSKAYGFYNELKTEQKFLLHGDFHHENILSATREPYLVIDPKGIIGQIGYEISVFLNNHVLWLSSAPDLSEKINDAVLRFAKAFAVEPQILRKWAFAQAVLSAWWTYEENGKNWEMDLESAKIWDV